MNHEEAEHLATKTARLFAQHAGEERLILAALRNEGLLPLEARKAHVFVQSAFGWALLKKMGVTKFPSALHFSSADRAFSVPVASEHLFMAALAVGVRIVENGYTEAITKEVFSTVVNSSAEVDAANKALNEGVDISGAEIATSFIGFEPKDFGVQKASWWQLWRK